MSELQRQSAPHVRAELGIDPDVLTNPRSSASAVSFGVGTLLPVLAIIRPPAAFRIPVTFAVELLALGPTGSVSGAHRRRDRNRAVARVVIGDALAMLVTFGTGQLVGATGI
jgi:VIT1/CCC1 family predicted Fe2+/Mn2+ transporter